MIEELAALIEAIDAAAESADAIPALLSTLSERESGLFADAVLLKGGRGGGAFVIVGGQHFSSASRTWMRWPLRRLFARMQPSRITNPCAASWHALAIPFSYPGHRYVVLASLTERAHAPEEQGFFTILERMTIPGARPISVRASDVPATPMEPMLAGYGLCDELYDRIDGTLRQRGWAIERLRASRDLWARLQEPAPDVIMVDLDEIEAPLSTMIGIHRVADSPALRILGFGQAHFTQYGAGPVVDRVLSHGAGDETLFRTIKGLARDATRLRWQHLHDREQAAQREAKTALTPIELARFGARRAGELMHGWACCVLLNEAGAVYRAEDPEMPVPVFSTIPKSFLSEAFFDLRVDDRFLSEVTDHATERMALMALKPMSGATLPIVSDTGERYGVLVACSRHRWADSAAFEALTRVARVVATRHRELASAYPLPEFDREGLWERLRDRALGIDVYRSSDCVIPWRYRLLTESSAMLTLGVNDEAIRRQAVGEDPQMEDREAMQVLASRDDGTPSFAATIDFTSQSMTYAAKGFTPPISLVKRGPMGAMQNAHGITTGTTILPSPGEAAIFEATLWRWLSHQSKAEQLRPLLDKEAPPGLASIVTLG